MDATISSSPDQRLSQIDPFHRIHAFPKIGTIRAGLELAPLLKRWGEAWARSYFVKLGSVKLERRLRELRGAQDACANPPAGH